MPPVCRKVSAGCPLHVDRRKNRRNERTSPFLEGFFKSFDRQCRRSVRTVFLLTCEDRIPESTWSEGEVGALSANETALVVGGLALHTRAVCGGPRIGRRRDFSVASDFAGQAGRDEFERRSRMRRVDVQQRTQV